MLSSELYYRVDNIDGSNISINGFKYSKVDVTLPGDIPMSLYVCKNCIKYLEVDKYFYTKRAYLTSTHIGVVGLEDFSFRIDYSSASTKEEFEVKDSTTVMFNARLGKKTRNVLKYLGPMRTPTYSIKAALKNEMGETFYVLVVGFYSKAKKLNELCKVCYVDIKGCISAPRKPGMPCAIVVKDYIFRKEVEV